MKRILLGAGIALCLVAGFALEQAHAGGRRRHADQEIIERGARQGILPAASVGTAEIADSAITSAKINDGTVAPGDATAALKTKTAVAQISLARVTDQKFIFVAPYACTISQVGIVSDTATTGDATTTNWTFQVANLTVSSNLLSSAYVATNAAGLTADTVVDLSPDQNLTLAANDVLELQATTNNPCTDLTGAEIAVTVEYY